MAGAKQPELTRFNNDKTLIPCAELKYAYEWDDPRDPRYCETRTLVIDEVVALPFDKAVLDQVSRDQQAELQPREFDNRCNRRLFPAARFDSSSGEYLLALLLNYTSDIVWWKRLYVSAWASIICNTKETYYPDFVPQDSVGTMWIIEGKSDKGRHDETVQAKRAAARVLVRELLGEEDFVGQKWGYVIAYESDIRASESWEDLKRKSNLGA